MDELKTALKIALANSFAMYYKAQAMHWNVEGMFFGQFHDFYESIYKEVYGSIDKTAEELRALEDYAPSSIDELYRYKTVNEAILNRDVTSQLEDLLATNTQLLESWEKVFEEAGKSHQHGLEDWASERLDEHNKHSWMLKSYLRK